jgi:hypothetical protein
MIKIKIKDNTHSCLTRRKGVEGAPGHNLPAEHGRRRGKMVLLHIYPKSKVLSLGMETSRVRVDSVKGLLI